MVVLAPLGPRTMASGRYQTKAPRPACHRELFDDLRSIWGVSIRRSCSVLQAYCWTYHYRPSGDEQADLKRADQGDCVDACALWSVSLSGAIGARPARAAVCAPLIWQSS